MELRKLLAPALREVGRWAGWIVLGIFAGVAAATAAKLLWGMDYDARNLGTAVWLLITTTGAWVRPQVAKGNYIAAAMGVVVALWVYADLWVHHG